MSNIYVDGYMTDGDAIVVYYHCASEEKWRETLCGKELESTLMWDTKNIFFGTKVPSNAERCPACLKHPDYPLLLLGTLP